MTLFKKTTITGVSPLRWQNCQICRLTLLSFIAVLLAGCATGPSVEDRALAQKATIHKAFDVFAPKHTETVDSKGNRVVLVRDYLYTATSYFDEKDRQRFVKTWRRICEASGNQWRYLPESADKVSRLGSNFQMAARAVQDWNASRGIELDGQSWFIEASAYSRAQQAHADRYNPVIAKLTELENYGEFHCKGPDGSVRWSLMRDFAGIAEGDPRSSINPGLGYSLDYRETFIVYEAQAYYRATDGGIAIPSVKRALPVSGWFVTLKKVNGAWGIANAKHYDHQDRAQPPRAVGEELVVLSEDLNMAMPLFAGNWTGATCLAADQRAEALYTICNSAFAKKEAPSILLKTLVIFNKNATPQAIDNVTSNETKMADLSRSLFYAALVEANIAATIRAKSSAQTK